MQSIGIYDPAWQTTFPHRVTPRKGEWLLGLLLHCDEENGWSSGTTEKFIAHSRLGRREPSYLTGEALALDFLAGALECPLDHILATTFVPELRRLHPNAHLERNQIGPKVPFHVCPECIAQGHMILRSVALPYLSHCTEHHILLQNMCRCGAPLTSLSDRFTKPFACKECGLLWSQLPRVCGDPEHIEIEIQLYSLYSKILMMGTELLIRDTLPLIRSTFSERRLENVQLLNGTTTKVSNFRKVPRSLAPVALTLVALGVSASEVGFQAPQDSFSCLNHTCPFFGRVDTNNIRRYNNLRGKVRHYCTMCGSRFCENRITSSFDIPTGCATRLPYRGDDV